MNVQRFVSFFGRPEFLQSFHGWGTVFWFILWGAAAFFGWLKQVQFVSHISMIALILGSWSAWQATRVEVKQDEELEDMIRRAIREELSR